MVYLRPQPTLLSSVQTPEQSSPASSASLNSCPHKIPRMLEIAVADRKGQLGASEASRDIDLIIITVS